MKPDQVRLWQSRAKRAKDHINKKTKDSRAAALSLYTGTFFGDAYSKSRDEEEVNFLFEFIKVSIASYYSRHPHIFVRTNASIYQPFVETLEKVMNYYVRELDVKGKAKTILLDGILTPPGWGKIGFTRIASNRKTIGKVESELGILDETRRNERVYFSHTPSWRVLFPDGYNNIRECPYIIEVESITLEDLMRNPIYKKSVVDQVMSSAASSSRKNPKLVKMKSNPQLTPASNQSDLELVNKKLFHVWDRRDRKRFTLVKGFYDDTLFEMDWNWLNEGFPLYPLSFNPVPETENDSNSVPMSDVQAMMPQLRQLSELTSAQMRHGRRGGALLISKNGDLSKDEKQLIQSSSDIDLVELENISESSLRTLTMPSIPGDWYALRGQTLEDLMRISGFQQLLQLQRGVDTATESENLRSGEILRVSERQDIVETFIKDVTRGLAALVWQFTSREQIERIIGEPASEEMWPTLPLEANGDPTPEAFRIVQEEIRYEIEAGSMRPPKDEMVERKQWEQLADIVQTRFPTMVKQEIILKQLLKKYDFKDIDEAVIGDEDIEIQVATEESRLMQKGIPQVVGPNENHEIHIGVHDQAIQQNPNGPTAEEDEHIAQHAEFLERKTGGQTTQSQQGGGNLPGTSGSSSNNKKVGVGNAADIAGAAAPDQRGIGLETSRR